MTSPFELLPKELKQDIIHCLDNIIDIRNLRLVCRELYVNSNRKFATWFRTVRVFMHPLSLQNLLNIAESSLVKDSVRSITISLHQLDYNAHPKVDEKEYVPSITNPTEWTSSFVTEEQVDLWWDLLDEQDRLHNSGAGSTMLLKALSSFPHLRNLAICNNQPWGMRKIAMLTGCHVTTSTCPLFLSCLFATCVDVLERSSTQIESFAVNLDSSSNVNLPALGLSSSHINLQRLLTTFKDLKHLTLTLVHHGAHDISSKALCRFLNQIPALRSLRLVYRRGDATGHADYPLQYWLGKGECPRLQELHLQDVYLRPLDIDSFTTRHRSELKKLTLNRVSLASKEDWQIMLRTMSKDVRLESLSVECPGCEGSPRLEEGERKLVWWKGMDWLSGSNDQVLEAEISARLNEASRSVQYDFEVEENSGLP